MTILELSRLQARFSGVFSAAAAAAGDWKEGSLVAIWILIQDSCIRIRIVIKDVQDLIKDEHQPLTMLDVPGSSTCNVANERVILFNQVILQMSGLYYLARFPYRNFIFS